MPRLASRKLVKGVPDVSIRDEIEKLRAEERTGRGKSGRPAKPAREPWTEIISSPDGTVEIVIRDDPHPAD